MNFIEHFIYDHKKTKRKFLLKFLRKKNLRKRFFQSDFFFQQVLQESPILRKSLSELVEDSHRVIFENCFSRNGNLTFYEMLVLVSFVVKRDPKRILEIGTFDGNTTLQMALNASENAIVHTIDLPMGKYETCQPVLESDIQFIKDEGKNRRKFEKKAVAHKIRQHFGDSTNYDFSKFTTEGPLDFIFIDGGHSYQCVKSDTENALKVLSENGCIFWHDFTPLFGGIFQFLCELSREVPLIHIDGTNLVFFHRSNDRVFPN